LTGNARAAFVSVSTLVSFWCSLVIAHKPYINNRNTIFLLLNFFPDLLYFNAFSLRDIMIVFVQCLFVLSLFEHIILKKRHGFLMLIFYASILMLLRNEVLIWCFASYVIFVVAKYVNVRTFIILTIISPFLVYVAASYAIPYLLYVLRLTNNIFNNSVDAVYFVIRARYYRQFSDADQSGSTSAILSPYQFENITPEVFILLSFFTALVVTYWKNGLLVNVARLTYAIVVARAVTFNLKSFRVSKLWVVFFLVAMLSYIIYAPLIVNGGNAFRMRLTSVALLLILSHVNYRWIPFKNE